MFKLGLPLPKSGSTQGQLSHQSSIMNTYETIILLIGFFPDSLFRKFSLKTRFIFLENNDFCGFKTPDFSSSRNVFTLRFTIRTFFLLFTNYIKTPARKRIKIIVRLLYSLFFLWRGAAEYRTSDATSDRWRAEVA